MAAITAASIKYGQPIRVDLGGLWLTATQIEIPGTTEEYATGGFEINKEKLGLPLSTPGGVGTGFAAVGSAGEAAVGENATSTTTPLLVWTTGKLCKGKEQNEEGKAVAEAYPCEATQIKGKIFVRIYGQETAGKAKPQLESLTADAVKLKEFTTTIFVLGR